MNPTTKMPLSPTITTDEVFSLPDGNELTAPSRSQKKSSFITARVSFKDSGFLESPDSKFETNIDECVIEVEARTQKDFQNAQQNTLDTKALRIYPPNNKSLRVEGLCRGRGLSESTSHLTTNIQKWKSVGSDIGEISLQISRREECKAIALVIFRHLQMFQYYHNWKKFDTSIKSLWLPPDEKKLKKKHLDYRFLDEWDNRSGKGLIQNWKLGEMKEICSSCGDTKCGTSHKWGILCKYGFIKQFMLDEFGENINIQDEDIENIEDVNFVRNESNLRIAEDKWGIWIKIAEEWEKTFVTLLEYYNTKDLRSICQSIFLNERGMTKNKLISVKELEKWMKPQMEPSPWMQILAKVSPRWRKKYRESKKKFQKDHENFIGSEATMFQKTIRGRSQITKQESTEKKKTLSKIDFVRSIVSKLRKGDEEVIISLKSLCHRMERAEFYRAWPPPIFMLGITIVQWIFYINHKLYYKKFLGTVHQSPICSVFVINHDRVWIEPWRFLTYGLIHNNLEHILLNSFCQLLFGIPLELSNSSLKVAIVYLSGIFLGGLLRESFISDNYPLSGASGGLYALVAAHLAQLIFNWHNDSFVLRQRLNFCRDHKSKAGEQIHKPPEALPMPRLWRIFRLFISMALLIVIIKQNLCKNDKSELCDKDVSHATHFFGAFAGLLTGTIVLNVRSYNRPLYIFRRTLLILIYGFAILWIFANYYHTLRNNDCPWIEYEARCQRQCYYPDENHRNNTSLDAYITSLIHCNVSLCI